MRAYPKNNFETQRRYQSKGRLKGIYSIKHLFHSNLWDISNKSQ